jgi:predicted DNA-binding transcriptional regulator AlpA
MRNDEQHGNVTAIPAEGYRVREWARGVGISASKVYELVRGELAAGTQPPRHVKIGATTIILESPREYLARIEALQHREAA